MVSVRARSLVCCGCGGCGVCVCEFCLFCMVCVCRICVRCVCVCGVEWRGAVWCGVVCAYVQEVWCGCMCVFQDHSLLSWEKRFETRLGGCPRKCARGVSSGSVLVQCSLKCVQLLFAGMLDEFTGGDGCELDNPSEHLKRLRRQMRHEYNRIQSIWDLSQTNWD